MNTEIENLIEHRYADINDIRIHYVIGGKGPTVLLIHGCPDFWYTWRYQIPLLIEAGYRVVAMDMRGYNLSTCLPEQEDYHIKNLIADVDALITHLGEDKVFLAAHDWGGIVGWFFIMNYPHRVRRYANLNILHPERWFTQWSMPKNSLKSSYVKLTKVEGLHETLFSGPNILRGIYTGMTTKPLSEEELNEYFKAFELEETWKAVWDYYRVMLKNLEEYKKLYIHKTDIPVLSIFGDKDTSLDKDLVQPLPELVSNIRIKHYPDATHWITHEKPQEIVDELIAFFNEEK